MCTTCGCSDGAVTTVNGETLKTMTFAPLAPANTTTTPAAAQRHTHDRESNDTVQLEQAILAKNDALAQRNRQWLCERGILAVNLLSSPGAGKTTLLEKTLRALQDRHDCCVVEGDQATERDAQRIRDAGARAVQINTGTGCHLEADMLERGITELNPAAGSILFIENVGNLVCPALFDLGEHRRVVILSTAEGEDKPIKYPHMFHTADLVLINKVDLLPHLDFDLTRALAFVREVKPGVDILCVSARTGEGMEAWCGWLARELAPIGPGERAAGGAVETAPQPAA